jgi:CDP-diacylglycerol--serine O-phosphatidyltransferase
MGLPFSIRHRENEIRTRRGRHGLVILPSLFTAFNIAAGYYAISQTLQGTLSESWHFDNAAKAIGFAVVFDGLDGRIARMTNTTSDFGRELDSLADVIAFGVAPAVLAWMWGFRLLDTGLRPNLVQLGLIFTFCFLMAGAARLARFNIQKNPQPSNPGRPGRKYFVGMPIPAAAAVVCTVVHFADGRPLSYWWEGVGWSALILVTAFLMVSTWRFYSFKDINLRSRHPFQFIVVFGGLIALIWFFSEYVLIVLALAYMLSGLVLRFLYAVRRRGSSPSPPQPEASELR